MTLSNNPRPLFKDQMYGVRVKGLPGVFLLDKLQKLSPETSKVDSMEPDGEDSGV